jgi:predicted dehydrogenase
VAENRRLRIGLLGAGRRGQAHLATISGLAEQYELVAVCDVVEASAQAAAEKWDVRAYSDVREFFVREKLDVVDIVTPPESHHLMAMVAAEHGVNMLIETPLATTRAMMDVIQEVAAKAGVQVEVGENMWRQPQAQLNRAAIDAGLIGNVLRVSTHYESIGQQGSYHQMSLMRFYTGGKLDEVRGAAHEFDLTGGSTGLDSEVWTQALLVFTNGALGTCTYVSSWLTPLRRGHPAFISIEGTDGFIVAGRGASAVHRVENGAQVVYPLRVETTTDGAQGAPRRYFYETTPTIEYVNPYADLDLGYRGPFGPLDAVAIASELASIHQAASGKAPPDFYGLDRARLDQEMSIAIAESARLDGRPVRLPLSGETEWERRVHEAFQKRFGGDPIADASQLIAQSFTGGMRY